ncbi:hypothetical protein HELRODRAFT_175519 [Helobdella robusta]|uniref:Nuclear speckle splicing regulatory protein 1 N-terminal domain-containing protein n=1 Tax=Helobdella robusta TaxID=6412 RepID=T1F9C6_HELRO|nr:hypothetical protein HELRODRAFT_175519 [Helobdella robusta]ESO00557.1 hypothetical protein HELRODRAFT_175519 [Helobdella robusta]
MAFNFNAPTKKYGLIIPKKDSNPKLMKSSAFHDNDSDDEKIAGKSNPLNLKGCSMIKPSSRLNNYIKKQTQLDIEKALHEDPNCFEYDKIYDEECTKKTQQKEEVKKDVKPKYIGQLMKAAEQRKREYERRVERTVQKEREAEQGMYQDKEAFVTTAYKEKMQRIKEEEEMEKKQQLLEELQSSDKDKGFVDFYRNILNQRVKNPDADDDVSMKSSKEKVNTCKVETSKKQEISRPSSSSSSSSSSSRDHRHHGHVDHHHSKKSEAHSGDKMPTPSTSSSSSSHHHVSKSYDKVKSHREIGKREHVKGSRSKDESSGDESSNSDSTKKVKRFKKDAGKNVSAAAALQHSGDTDDDSIVSSSSSEDGEYELKSAEGRVGDKVAETNDNNNINNNTTTTTNNNNNNNNKVDDSNPISGSADKPKHDKRTVGDTLSDAKARYLARKMASKSVPIISTDD